ncbi:MAG: manganese transporter [Flavobacteriaceae bacterium]|nr:manganese transporter [Flavobacteriaceae bacterium]
MQFKSRGIGLFVTAAFIGPGTLTICTLAGFYFKLNLLWALLLSVMATYFFQEMAIRISLVLKQGLAKSMVQMGGSKYVKWILSIVISCAIIIGNSAYEAGNINGALLGLKGIFGSEVNELLMLLILVFGIVVILWLKKLKWIKLLLMTLVFMMSLSFVIAVVSLKPSISEIILGSFTFNVPSGSWSTILALIGTTVVPYNLFLHSSLVQMEQLNSQDLNKVRLDTLLSIVLGGFISICILITSRYINNVSEVSNATDMSFALQSVFGSYAVIIVSLGLFAAGLSSAITAPLAAALITKDLYNGQRSNLWYTMTWILVVFSGLLFSILGSTPIEIIKLAQISNGILLPIVIVMLLIVLNSNRIEKEFRNSWLQNIFGFLFAALTLLLATRIF